MQPIKQLFQATADWFCSSGRVMTPLGSNPKLSKIGNVFASPAFKAAATISGCIAAIDTLPQNGSAAEFGLHFAGHIITATAATTFLIPRFAASLSKTTGVRDDYYVVQKPEKPVALVPEVEKDNRILFEKSYHEFLTLPPILLGFGAVCHSFGQYNYEAVAIIVAATVAGGFGSHAYRAQQVLGGRWAAPKDPPPPPEQKAVTLPPLIERWLNGPELQPGYAATRAPQIPVLPASQRLTLRQAPQP
jgi:hypothetical protein